LFWPIWIDKNKGKRRKEKGESNRMNVKSQKIASPALRDRNDGASNQVLLLKRIENKKRGTSNQYPATSTNIKVQC
jgi:hypothetical protein